MNHKTILSFFVLCIFIWGCSTNSEPFPTSGTIEIIYSQGDDIATGFLFEEGVSFTLAERPNTEPNFLVSVHISESKVEGLFLVEPELEPSFILLSEANDADSANTFFDTLSFFPDTTLTDLALPLRENQVWGVKTKNDHFAKILIQEVWAKADTSSSNLITHSGSLTMKWQYQPNGSREF